MVLNLTSVRNMLCSNVFSFKLSDVEKVNYDVETKSTISEKVPPALSSYHRTLKRDNDEGGQAKVSVLLQTFLYCYTTC